MQRPLKLTKSAVFGAWLAVAVATQATAQEQPGAITVFVAKKIATMDPTLAASGRGIASKHASRMAMSNCPDRSPSRDRLPRKTAAIRRILLNVAGGTCVIRGELETVIAPSCSCTVAWVATANESNAPITTIFASFKDRFMFRCY